jgi:hypothetical protein
MLVQTRVCGAEVDGYSDDFVGPSAHLELEVAGGSGKLKPNLAVNDTAA